MQTRDSNTLTEKALFGSGKTREQQMTRESYSTNVEQLGSTNEQSRRHEQYTGNAERMFSCEPNVDKVFCEDDLRSGHTHTRSCNFVQNDKMVEQMRDKKGWEYHVIPEKHALNPSLSNEKTFPYQETPNYDQMFSKDSFEDLEKSQTCYRGETSQTSYRFESRPGEIFHPFLSGYSRQVFSSEPLSMDQSEAQKVFLGSNTAAAQSPNPDSDDEFYDCETHSERFRRALSRFETSGLQSDRDIESSQTSFRAKSISSDRDVESSQTSFRAKSISSDRDIKSAQTSFCTKSISSDRDVESSQTSFRTKSISKKSCHFAEPKQNEDKYVNKSIRIPSDYEDVFYSETKNEQKLGSTSRIRERNDTGYGSGSSMFSNNESLSELDNYEITGIRILQPSVTVQRIITNNKSDVERAKSVSSQEYRNIEGRKESKDILEDKDKLEFQQRNNSSSFIYESNENKAIRATMEPGTDRTDVTNEIDIELESKIILTDESSTCVDQGVNRIRIESNSPIINKNEIDKFKRKESFETSKSVKYTIKGLGTIPDINNNEIEDIQSKSMRTISFEDSPNTEQKKKKIKVKEKQRENISNEPTTESTKKTETSSSLQPNHVPVPRLNISFAFVSKDTLDRVTSQAKRFPAIKSSDCSTMTDLQKADARIGKIVSMLKQNHTDISNDVIKRKLSTNQNKEMGEKKPVKTSFQIKLKNPEIYKSVSNAQVNQSSKLDEDKNIPKRVSESPCVSSHNIEGTSCLTKAYSTDSKTLEINEPTPKDRVSAMYSKEEETKKSKHIEPNIVESQNTIQKTDKSTSNVSKANSTLDKTEKPYQEMKESQKEKESLTLDFGSKTKNKMQGQKGQIKGEMRKHRSSRTVEEKTIVTNIITTEEIHEMSSKDNLVENFHKRKSKSIPIGLDKSSTSVPSAVTLNGNIKVQFEADNSNEKLLKKGMDARIKQRSRTESYERILSAPYRKSSEGTVLNNKGIIGQYLDKLMTTGGQKGTSKDNQNKLRQGQDKGKEIQGVQQFSTQSASQDFKTGLLKSNKSDSKEDFKKNKDKYSSDSDIKRRSRTVSFERILPTYHQNRRKNSEQNEKRVSRREVKIFQLLNKNQNTTKNEEADKRKTDAARQFFFKHLKEGGENTQKAPSEVTLHRRISSISRSGEEDACYCNEEMDSYRYEKLSPAKYHLKGFGCSKRTSSTPKNDANMKLSNDVYKMMKNNEHSTFGDSRTVGEGSVEAINEKLAKLQASTNMKSEMDKKSTETSRVTEKKEKLQDVTNSKTEMIRNTLRRNIDNRRTSSTSCSTSDVKNTIRTSSESIRIEPNRNTNTELRQQQKTNVISKGRTQQNEARQTSIQDVKTDQANSKLNDFHRQGQVNEEIKVSNHYNYSNSPAHETINKKEANSINSSNSFEDTFYHEKKGCHDTVDSINQHITTKNNIDQNMNSKTVGKKDNQCLFDRGGDIDDLHENDNNKDSEGRNSSKRTVYKCNIIKCHEVPLKEKRKGNSIDDQNVNKEIPQQVKRDGGREEEIDKMQIKGNETYDVSGRLNENNIHASSRLNTDQRVEANTLHSMEDSRKYHDVNNPLLVHMNKTVKHSVEYENILPNRNSQEKMDVIFREFVDIDKPKVDGSNFKKTVVSENGVKKQGVENNKRPVSEGFNDKSKKMVRRRSVKIYSTGKNGIQKEKTMTTSKSESDVTSSRNKFVNPESPSINLLNCHDPFETVCSLEKCTSCHHHDNKNKELGGKVKNHETTISYEYKLDRKNPLETAKYDDVVDNYKKTYGDLKEEESEKPLNVIIRRNVNHEITKTELLIEMNK